MKDVVIPVGLLIFIVLFAYAMVHSARKQRASKKKVFEEFARDQGLSYLDKDDGRVQEFTQDFDGVGRFWSPSLGNVIPKNVISGKENSSRVFLFRHSIRYSAGWAREWFVSGLAAADHIADRCAIQFCKKGSDKSTMYLQDDIVKVKTIGDFDIVVRSQSSSCAGKLLDERVLKQLAEFAEDLPFRPEIQVRGKRVIAYLADRNASIDDVRSLKSLFEFTKKAAGI
ncbi:hypothetical protein [Halomonas nitroreducens]|uniref:DUF3137 domain-containing protein n=1 Tax=Halomonas nitroreducens TaxID=447425 RepID=A0A431V737_9GAMM|nr:hypothetical protein [Halomonas nitroreducens]RTR05883.1 hypothetical protein EKG36_03780 [Halomonas nitroreducens]